MVCLSILVPKRATICHVTVLKLFVITLGCELAAFTYFLKNPADYRLFVTDLIAVDLHGHNWKSKPSFNIFCAKTDQP